MKSLHAPEGKRSDPLGALHLVPGQQVGHRDAQQANWPVPAIELGHEERVEHRQHGLCVLEPLRAADAARDELEIAPFDLEHERPPTQVQFDQAVFYLPGEVPQDAFHAVPVHEVALEGDFLPDRLTFPVLAT
jgi:hypothetical protein